MNNFIHRKICRVLLIRPPATIIKSIEPKSLAVPLGLAYLGAVLEDNYDVKILDAMAEGFEEELFLNDGMLRYGLSSDKMRDKIREFSPDVVGISCLFSVQFVNALDVCRIIKKIDENIITILGGSHPSALPQEVLKEKEIDLVVMGEGEKTLEELLGAINEGADFAKIDGIAYRVGEDIFVNAKTKYIKDLDSLPFPARHLLPMDKYFEVNRPHGSTALRKPNTVVISSRGCPGRCVFCSIHTVWGKAFRARSAENVLMEIEHLIKRYGIKEVQFGDDNLILDKERAKKIFRGIISRKMNISWNAVGGVALWKLDEELIQLMKESGCYRLSLPIESGDQYVLDNIIRKPVDLNKVRPMIDIANKYHIKTDALFVIGLPGETKKQLQNTFKYVRNLPVDNINFFFATPFPGTELLKICQDKKRLRPNFDYRHLRAGEVNIVSPEFTRQELERMVARELIRFRVFLLFRDPAVFFERNVLRFFKDRRYFLNLARKLLMTLMLKQKEA